MTTVFEIPAGEFIKETAKDLKENIKISKPKWADIVKTGSHKDTRPEDNDWWFHRAASVLRKVYVHGPIGVRRLRVAYGGRKNRGHKPEISVKAGGKIIRAIFQDLDKQGFTENTKGGRRITQKGRSYLDKIASKMAKK